MADNVFSTAQIRVEAETSKAEQALKDLRGKMDELGSSLQALEDKQKAAADAGAEFSRVATAMEEVKDAAKEVNALMRVLSIIDAPTRVAREFFQLGKEIEAVGEKILGLNDDVGDALAALADEDSSPVQKAKAKIRSFTKQWLDGGLIEEWKQLGRQLDDAIFGTSRVDEFNRRQNEKLKQLKDQLKAATDQELENAAQLQARKNQIAERGKEEQLNLELGLEIEHLNTKYGASAGPFIDKAKREAAAKISAVRAAAEEEEQRKQKQLERDLADIEERKNAYMDLIRKQEAAEIQSKQRIADATEQMTTRVLTSISQQFEKLFDIRQMTMTLEAVNANLKALVNKRQGF